MGRTANGSGWDNDGGQVRIIVCGSRDWDDYGLFCSALEQCVAEVQALVIVHGAARGADTMADRWVSDRASMNYRVSVERHPADWDRHGKGAGPIRNRAMAKAGADRCLAFWDGESRGTLDMITVATQHGIPVRIVPAARKP
jgi:hypothetical protein